MEFINVSQIPLDANICLVMGHNVFFSWIFAILHELLLSMILILHDQIMIIK